MDYTSRSDCNFSFDRHDLCEKDQANYDFVRGAVPLAAKHKLPLIVHCEGLNDNDGREAEDVRLLIKETGHSDLPIHRDGVIENSGAFVDKAISKCKLSFHQTK